MLYSLLQSYRAYLETIYSKETARTYYNRIVSLFEGQSITDITNKLDINKVMSKLEKIEHKNYFSQTKNAFLHFCEYQNINLSSDVMEKIKQLETNTHKKYRKLKVIDYKQIDNSIKHIKNSKLRLCYQTIISTGLRVSELASIKADDCTITDNEIIFSFIGKGGDKETVKLIADEYPKLYQDLKELIKDTSTGKKVFYSAIYLQINAKKLGFECHDLRRIFARLEYKKSKSKVVVMKKLRHSNIKTTSIYLNSRIKF